jgi:methionine-rich copper-binding protein CopC
MQRLRIGIERLLLLLFSLLRRVFLLQGLAAGCACVGAFALVPADPPAWLRNAMASALLLSGMLFAAGLLLIAVRRWRVPDANPRVEAGSPWPPVLAATLLGLAMLAGIAGSGLPSLWRVIASALDAAGFWDEWARGGANSGMVMLPLMVMLVVPVLVTAATLFAIAFPVTLLPLLALRSGLFPTLLAMGAVCQVALVGTGWLSATALSQLAERVLAAMAADADAEMLVVANELKSAVATLVRTATALLAPTAGLLTWLAYLRPTGPAAAWFAEAGSTVRTEPVVARPPPPWTTAETSARARRARIGLAMLGVLMLVWWAADALRTRASYLSSEPSPGARLEAAPSTVRIRFRAELDPASSIDLTRLGNGAPGSGLPLDIAVVRRLASDDPQRRTLEAIPAPLSAGLYQVSWRALPAGGGVPRYGSYSFGLGMPVPVETRSSPHSLTERDEGARGRRHTLLGGLLLVVLGGILPRLLPGGTPARP